MPRRVWIVIFLLTLLLNPGEVVAQQEGVAKWLRYVSNITIQQNSGIAVEEIQEVVLSQGTTTFRREIPTDRIEDVSSVSVLEINPRGGQRTYQLADTKAEYTFEVNSEGNQRVIQLYFPPNSTPSTTFVIRYFVVGGLSFYDDGDRFEWQPFGSRTIAPIDTSNTVITLPELFAEDQVVRSSSGLGNVNSYFSEGNKITFVAGNIPNGSNYQVLVIFPHGVVQGSPPEWQHLADWTPILRWGSILLGLLFLFLSVLAVVGWWFLRVRVSPSSTVKVPKYLKSPPSDVAPAVAGALLDGKVNPRHIMATLVNMADHGVLNIDGSKKDPDSLLPDDEETDQPVFDLYAVDQSQAIKSYEEALYSKIFGYAGGKKRQLAGIRETLFMSVPELKKQIEFEIAKEGYFAENLSGIRRQYLAFGGAGLIVTLVLAVLTSVLLSRYTYLGGCIFMGMAFGAVVLMGIGFALPKRTEVGATQAARWKAFKRYLTDMNVKYAAKIKSEFARLLPYAVAFGIEEEFVEKFATANAPIPKWWGKPAEKQPDVGHDQAHAWVSSSYMEATPESGSESPAKGVIRRLGKSGGSAQSGTLLKHIKPMFLAFLNAGYEVFAKAPPLDETQEVDFEKLEQKQQ